MARKRHSAEEIVNKLREAEVLLSGGATVAHACKQLEQQNARLRRPPLRHRGGNGAVTVNVIG